MLQFLSSAIEVLALGLIGIFSVVITARLTSQDINGDSNSFFASFSGFFSDDPKFLIMLGITATLLLLLKTVFGVYLNRTLNVSLAKITSRLSLAKLEEISKVKYSWIRDQNSAEFSYYLGPGINSDLKGKLLGIYTIISEVIFIITVSAFLAFSNLLLTVFVGVLIIVFFVLIYYFVTRKFRDLNQSEVKYLMKNQQFATEMFKSFKELIVSNDLEIFQDQMRESRVKENSIRGKMQWLEQLPKFALELFVLLLGVLILVVSAVPSDAIKGATSLIVFSVALSRLTPSLLRLQAAFVIYEACRHRVENSSKFFLGLLDNRMETLDNSIYSPQSGLPVIEFLNVNFEYGENKRILEDFSCRFEAGKVNCIVGPSGVGKSTVLELALGLITPNNGQILVGGLEPNAWRKANPNSSYYLPQDIAVIESSLYENVVMSGKIGSPAKDELIIEILEKVGLQNVSTRHPKGLNAVLGSEIHLSGGERQRLGIARALFKESKILVLDEPTSSLDEQTEEGIFEIFRSISDTCTIVLVTHSQKAISYFPESLITLRGA